MSERRMDLLHPVALVAIALLLVNDQWMKTAHPGWLTGKLSDAAGLVFFPLLLAAMFGRVRACIVVTMVGFALVKLWSPATEVLESALGLIWGSVRIVRDPTDLLALPFALWAWPATVARCSSSSMSVPARRRSGATSAVPSTRSSR